MAYDYSIKTGIDNREEARSKDGGAAYKTYDAALTGDVIFAIADDLKDQHAVGGYIKNDGDNAFSAQFSVDQGVSYGDLIVIGAGEELNFDQFIVFTHIKLVHTADSDYRLLVM